MVKKAKKEMLVTFRKKKSLTSEMSRLRVGVQQRELEFSEEKNSRLTLKAQL